MRCSSAVGCDGGVRGPFEKLIDGHMIRRNFRLNLQGGKILRVTVSLSLFELYGSVIIPAASFL